MPLVTYRELLREQLRRDEGVRDRPYKDSVGKLTIGVGHNLDDKPLPAEVIDLLLEHDMRDAEMDARLLLRNFDELSDARKAVVVNMAFNLGRGRLAGFTNTLKAIREGRWADAAAGMRASLWATQVGARAERLARLMEHDQP